jgi:hypothetical protein
MSKKRATSDPVKEFYSTTEAAAKIGITDSLVSRYCRNGFQGRSVGQKVGRNYILSHAELVLIRDSERKVGRPKTVFAEG